MDSPILICWIVVLVDSAIQCLNNRVNKLIITLLLAPLLWHLLQVLQVTVTTKKFHDFIQLRYSLEVTYSNPKHPHTKPNEPKCVRCGENRLETLRVSRPEENMRYHWGGGGEGGARTASEGTETQPGDLWRHCGGLGKESLMPCPINQRAHQFNSIQCIPVSFGLWDTALKFLSPGPRSDVTDHLEPLLEMAE